MQDVIDAWPVFLSVFFYAHTAFLKSLYIKHRNDTDSRKVKMMIFLTRPKNTYTQEWMFLQLWGLLALTTKINSK